MYAIIRSQYWGKLRIDKRKLIHVFCINSTNDYLFLNIDDDEDTIELAKTKYASNGHPTFWV